MATASQEKTKKTVRDLTDIAEKRVLVRVDFNVPLKENGEIADDTRIQESLPTLRYLLEKGARVIVVSHLGRPKGKPDPKASLKVVADHLLSLLSPSNVKFIPANDQGQVVSDEAKKAVDALKNGELLLLENIRFEAGEEKNDPELSKRLANLADVYVNDAFGAAHRAHASTEGVAHLAEVSVAGLLMDKEIRALGAVVKNPQQPFVAIIGGSKVSTKITVLESLLPKVNTLIIGGGMIFTFLKAQGLSVGKSLLEDEFVAMAKDLLQKAKAQNVTLLLAEDVVIADAFKADAQAKTVAVDAIADGWMGLDIGPKTIEAIKAELSKAKTVLWNGPLGVFEFEAFSAGTRAVAETLADLSEKGQCKSILGGGDTVASIERFGIAPERYSHVSTGGGASLEFLEGKTLPGIAALD
ncbi:MAG: phosphoglycerate kinase [Vampirovibrionales bacterium]|nr:phosphoglycerate kinase [Vampirovibrionales bacterium]